MRFDLVRLLVWSLVLTVAVDCLGPKLLLNAAAYAYECVQHGIGAERSLLRHDPGGMLHGFSPFFQRQPSNPASR